jgi:hypothetical protein
VVAGFLRRNRGISIRKRQLHCYALTEVLCRLKRWTNY